MGLFSKKKKNEKPTGDKACQEGYVSFTPEDIKAKEETSKDNREAYDLLWQAVTTSSHITKKDKKGHEVPIDDVYPVSLEETLEMEDLLNQAEAKIQDHNDTVLKDQIDEVRYIIDWSKKRHYNFSWMIILGVILGLFILNYFRKEPREKAKNWDKIYNQVDKSWTEQDTTISWDEVEGKHIYYRDEKRFANANSFKAMTAEMHRGIYDVNIDGPFGVNKCQSIIDTASKRSTRNYYKDLKKTAQKHADEALEKGQEICNADYDDVHKIAKKEAKKIRNGYRKEARKYTIWIWIFIIMIPLYIYADRPYGWMETRHRLEAKILGGIKKIAYSIATGLFFGALFMPDVPDYIVTYRDGHKEREADMAGQIMQWGVQALMILAALFIAAIASAFIMTYSTVVGLRRNYDWSSIKADVKTKLRKE